MTQVLVIDGFKSVSETLATLTELMFTKPIGDSMNTPLSLAQLAAIVGHMPPPVGGNHGHPFQRKFGRRPWGRGRNRSGSHQRVRECARRIVQIAKGRLAGRVGERQGRKDQLEKLGDVYRNVAGPVVTRSESRFISPRAEHNAEKIRLRALGLYTPGDRVIIERDVNGGR